MNKQDETVQSSEDEPIMEEMDFENPHFRFEPKDKHEWRQQGPYIICKTCDLEHAVFIGMQDLLINIDEETGQPILSKRV